MRLGFTALVFGGAVAAYLWLRAGQVAPAEAKRRVADGALLLDVRSPSEFIEGHLDGAVNIPVSELAERITELGDPSRAIVVYCQSGARSARAKRMLVEHGFAEVYNLGGMSRWP